MDLATQLLASMIDLGDAAMTLPGVGEAFNESKRSVMALACLREVVVRAHECGIDNVQEAFDAFESGGTLHIYCLTHQATDPVLGLPFVSDHHAFGYAMWHTCLHSFESDRFDVYSVASGKWYLYALVASARRLGGEYLLMASAMCSLHRIVKARAPVSPATAAHSPVSAATAALSIECAAAQASTIRTQYVLDVAAHRPPEYEYAVDAPAPIYLSLVDSIAHGEPTGIEDFVHRALPKHLVSINALRDVRDHVPKPPQRGTHRRR